MKNGIPRFHPVDKRGSRIEAAQDDRFVRQFECGMPFGNTGLIEMEVGLSAAADNEFAAQRNDFAEIHARQTAQQDARRISSRRIGSSDWRRRSRDIRADILIAIGLEHELHAAETDHVSQAQDRALAHRARVHVRTRLRVEHGKLDATLAQFQAKMVRRDAGATDNDVIVWRGTDSGLAETDQGVVLLLVRERNTHAMECVPLVCTQCSIWLRESALNAGPKKT